MANILFGSIVRNGENYIQRYYDQVSAIKNHHVAIALTEGDSTDNTYSCILNKATNSGIATNLFKFDHKGNVYGSVDVAERWQNIAKTWNYMLDNIQILLDNYDYFCYMEDDLIWDSETIEQLIWDCDYFDAVAPMSMLGGIFYDTWGHRAFGENFTNTYPYHSHFNKYQKYMPITSAGSCIMMQSKVAKVCRLNPTDAMIGHDIIKNKFTFVLNKTIAVHHP